MFARASVGLELPSKRALPPAVQLYLVHRHAFIAQCSQRPGRLLPCRALGRALRALLRAYEIQVERLIRTVPPKRRNGAARNMRRAFRRWRRAIIARYLTGHYLRVNPTERFCCWRLPPCAYEQLLRQLQEAQGLEAGELRLLILVPLTPHIAVDLVLQDQLAVYLHAPARSATGNWLQVPPERVHATVCGGQLVVVVE